jgi:ferritin
MELSSSLAYMAIHAYFDDANLEGFAHWMRRQYEEEHRHAVKLFDFMLLRGSVPTILSLEAPTKDFASPLSAMQTALEHEQKVTAAINSLYDLAAKESDHATQVMLQWFINEQLEEERSVEMILEQVRLSGENSGALLLIDSKLAGRKAEPAAGEPAAT